MIGAAQDKIDDVLRILVPAHRPCGRDEPAERLGGSLAAALFSAGRGADVLRVHDVAATVQALAVNRALNRR